MKLRNRNERYLKDTVFSNIVNASNERTRSRIKSKRASITTGSLYLLTH